MSETALALLVLYIIGVAVLLVAWITPRSIPKKGSRCRHRF
jgi:hypothetical protein